MMAIVLLLMFVTVLVVAAALGWTADSREPGSSYPIGPDRDPDSRRGM